MQSPTNSLKHTKVNDNVPEAHIFLCYTSFHVLISSIIAQEQSLNSSCQIKVLIDVNEHLSMEKNHVWDKIISASKIQGYNHHLKTQIKKLSEAKSIFTQLVGFLNQYDKVVIYYAHLEEYLTNHLYFYFKHPNVTYNIIQDGILNFYGVQVDRKRLRKHISKAILGVAFRFPYRPFLSYITGVNHSNVKKQYLLGAAELSDFPEKSTVLSNSYIKKKNFSETTHDSILILGQEAMIYDIGYEQFYNHLYDLLIFVTQNFPHIPKYYRPRHNGLLQGKTRQNIISQGISILDAQGSIEDLYNQNIISCYHIISFTSSALINMKLLFGDSVECYSFNFKTISRTIPNTENQDRLARLFTKVGVNFV